MPFSESWLENEPDGSLITVAELDNWIRKTKIAIRERLEDSLFLPGSWAAAPVVNPALLGGGGGGGSGTIPFPYTHTGSSSGLPAFYVIQGHATGLGIKVQVATQANYAVMVADPTNTYRRWQVTGEGMMQGEVAAPYAAAIPTLRRPDGGVVAQWYSRLGGGDSGSELFISNQSTTNTGGASPQYGGASHLASASFGGWDGGSRFGINIYYDGTGAHLYEPYRPGAYCGFASDGTWTFNWVPPQLTTFGAQADTTLATSNSPYTLAGGDAPYFVGQNIILDGGAEFGIADGQRTATMAAQRKSNHLQFAVTPDRTVDLPGIVALRLLGTVGESNRVKLFVNGALRQVLAFNDGAGHNVLYY